MSSYIDHRASIGTVRGILEVIVTHSWREHTRARLEWIYGFEKARRIIHGVDGETQADVAAWNMLGRRRGAA